ncbi:sigma 54-interacting transcriptional regulator [Blattabacterium cuenoti]|uniref:sigma 54-interacting transcriptional regulator n=1 Tax=Blattabacterium cuenoti TaxID=1653831 RepID=UPI00163C7D72|nr:sigma-54 dependent transcriptional regulator [Blattabacterium cuenoti]
MDKFIQNIKQKFNIIGNDHSLQRTIEKSIQVAPSDISVLVLGESGVGKEIIPKIIHQFSFRKHNSFIAVNCGAIPEGTIDSELFGHEKGSFTGAINMRKGYFEEANGGTIFLDEVGELPITTQVRLLRILESGEFIKVGSSHVQKTNIRVVAATNLNMIESIRKGKFREDLYYRLNTVQINIPPLRFRKNDIEPLFKKFSNDFSEKYKIPPIKLTEKSLRYLEDYPWPGNIRQLKNLIEQISIIEKKREISIDKLKEYIPENSPSLSFPSSNNERIFQDFSSERDFLYKVLFDMKKNFNNLKSLIFQFIKNKNNENNNFIKKNQKIIEKVFGKIINSSDNSSSVESTIMEDPIFRLEHSSSDLTTNSQEQEEDLDYEEIEEDSYKNESKNFSLQKKEIEFIQKSLKKNNGKRKKTAKELGISERTLYRKIKQYGL